MLTQIGPSSSSGPSAIGRPVTGCFTAWLRRCQVTLPVIWNSTKQRETTSSRASGSSQFPTSRTRPAGSRKRSRARTGSRGRVRSPRRGSTNTLVGSAVGLTGKMTPRNRVADGGSFRIQTSFWAWIRDRSIGMA